MAKAKAITGFETITELGAQIARSVKFTGRRIVEETPADEAKAQNLLDLQKHCEDRIFWTLAQSPQDALIQIARISAEVDNFEADREDAPLKWKILERDLTRALYSLTRWIGIAHNIERPDIMEFYMSERFDPWNTLLPYRLLEGR